MDELDITPRALSRELSLYLPDWGVSLVILALALVAGLLAYKLVFRLLTRAVARRDLFWRSVVSRSRRPIRLALVALALAVGAGAAPLSNRGEGIIVHALLIAAIVLIAWIARIVLHSWTTVYLRQFSLEAEDNLLARKHVTQGRIFEKVANVLILMLAAAAVLMTFDTVRQYGVSLLASAGAAGLVVGFALQPVLKNLFAGIQLAITQPIRIDDAVIVEGEWGQVEEITGTYVVIRIWDLRRLIVPLSYFIEQPFQNWTRESASLIGVVLIYLDHTADVARLRREAQAIVEASALWDGRTFAVQVTDFRERVMEVRVLASARNAGMAFDLRCAVREKLVAWLQREMPHALPRTREEVSVDGGVLPPEVLGQRGEDQP